MWIIPCLWAGAFLTGATALERLSADTLSFLRFAVTMVVGVPLLWRPLRATLGAMRTSPTARRQWQALLVLAIVGGVLSHVAFNYGLARTEAPVASVLIALNPIFTTIAATLLARTQRPTIALFVGLILAFAGVLALAADKALADGDGRLGFIETIWKSWGHR